MEHQMKCMVCGTKNDNFICPVCGFMSSVSYGGFVDSDLAEEIREADEYRAGMLEQVQMKIPVYSYKEKIRVENGRLKEIKEPDKDYIVLKGKDLQLDHPVWFSERFVNQNRDLDLKYEIAGINGETRSYSEVIKDPGIEDETLKIGIVLRPELKISVVIGNENLYTCSPLYDLK